MSTIANKWKLIWDKREEAQGVNVQEMLLRTDGFSEGAGYISLDAWDHYIHMIIEKLAAQPKSSIFEGGCGAGALIYNLEQQGFRTGGVDYSQQLINIAKDHLKSQDLDSVEAINIHSKKRYDHVISNSVFQYFPGLDYARAVIEKMIEKSNKSIAILDVNDKQYEEKALRERMEKLGPEKYKKKYEGLEHLFYDKCWFVDLASEMGVQCRIEDQQIEAYGNASFRYNVFLFKEE
jgi:hypothetical protein